MPATRELLAATGITLSDDGTATLHERTEGWAAGLRLATIALAGHPEPERFVAEFCGAERTVAAFLHAEVLDRQPPEVRDLLLRTSVLDRVNGPLADALTGRSGSLRILHELEDANAFVDRRSTSGARGSATTACSPICCGWSCDGSIRPSSARCTARPPAGSSFMGARSRRSATRSPPATGTTPRACWPTTSSG